MTRRRLLTAAQARELCALYTLGRENTPKRLAEKFGISHRTLRAYVRGVHKSERRRCASEDFARELGYE